MSTILFYTIIDKWLIISDKFQLDQDPQILLSILKKQLKMRYGEDLIGRKFMDVIFISHKQYGGT